MLDFLNIKEIEFYLFRTWNEDVLDDELLAIYHEWSEFYQQ